MQYFIYISVYQNIKNVNLTIYDFISLRLYRIEYYGTDNQSKAIQSSFPFFKGEIPNAK